MYIFHPELGFPETNSFAAQAGHESEINISLAFGVRFPEFSFLVPFL
jgi:hypothetical protein